MGHIVGDLGYADMIFLDDGLPYLEVTLSCGSPAAHTGVCIGKLDTSANRLVAARVCADLIGATTQASFESVFNALPVYASGPWPGVSPATWLASLAATQRSILRDQFLARAAAGRLW